MSSIREDILRLVPDRLRRAGSVRDPVVEAAESDSPMLVAAAQASESAPGRRSAIHLAEAQPLSMTAKLTADTRSTRLTRSGAAAARSVGAATGTWLPGRNLPCLASLPSTTSTRSSCRTPAAFISVLPLAAAP